MFRYFVISFFILFIILFGLVYYIKGNNNNSDKKKEDDGKRLFLSLVTSLFVSLIVVGIAYGYFYYRQNAKVYLDEDFYD